MKIKRALISVWNKEGVIELATFLKSENIEIISTGGTRNILVEAGLEVKALEKLTKSPSVMNGRVKTLHPRVFGGILADRNNKEHLKDLDILKGLEIDLVVVNFYPFIQEVIKNNQNDLKDAIEYIDIGGPSMIRAAAKNYNCVVPLIMPELYNDFMKIYQENDGTIPVQFKKILASKVFSITAKYDAAISSYLCDKNDFSENKIISIKKHNDLRYGENPHQRSAFYLDDDKVYPIIQHQGKQLSYNNYLDLESAYSIVLEFNEPACAIIKHSNPCGFGLSDNLVEAYKRAVSTDPVSYFGGIVALNHEVDQDIAEELIKPFLECIIAPSFSISALNILKNKKNLRLISPNQNYEIQSYSLKSVLGGFLYQDIDKTSNAEESWEVVTNRRPSSKELNSMRIGWKLVRFVKSNAIVFSNQTQLLGIGAGQMSRVDSVKIAIQKILENGLNLNDGIMASDAFFPFSDSLELAAKIGIKGIIHPGGSINDKEIIKKANSLDLAMIHTSKRHFLH